MAELSDFNRDDLHFVPLGGSEQFGVNLNVYMTGGQLLVVDCGIGFADERFPGIDLLLPDPMFLEDNRDAIQALVITHAHEDHVGAVAYLWNRLRCPIYTTPFTAEVLRHKLKDEGIKDAKVHVIEPLENFEAGVFDVQFLPVSHSVPDTCALKITTSHGNVMHSGDWNLDPMPVVGYKTEQKTFEQLGKDGVLAYVGDSTNAEVNGRSGSEAEVAKGLEAVFKTCKGRIVVTTFSSNIGRAKSIIKAAQAVGRDVGVIGRSLHRMLGCAYECGYMDDMPDLVSEEDLGYLPDDKTVIIMTGSQGEYRAALARAARGDHRNVTLNRGDTVIFSARSIPGNERGINDVKNNLTAAGVRVISPSDTKHTIHVSGHPCRDEIAEMFQWIRPKAVIPVHGERTQLEAHASFAKECQVPYALVPSNGTVIKLAPGEPEIIDHVPTGVLAVDQKRIITSDHLSIAERRKLQYTGAVHISVVLDARGKILGEPMLDTVGLIDPDNTGEEKIEDKMHDEILDLIDDLTFEERLDDHFVSEELRIGLRRFCVHSLGLKPKTTVHVIRV